MRKYSEKDETMIQIGVSIGIRISSMEIELKECADRSDYSKAAGLYNIVTGLKIGLNEISTHFLSNDIPIKNRSAEFNEAVENRMQELRKVLA